MQVVFFVPLILGYKLYFIFYICTVSQADKMSHWWYWVLVFSCDLVEFAIVHAHPQTFVLLLDEKDW
ncbi:hypothetical protein PPACK8108_LOCUS7802 [Phakopsora pachyrhizi]|uniref:Uncharacterized protein n=1 Tax=Phakopsora pachyrhizi TaxID=170000 RepID=A0AAV0AWA9_PHAPC|nr:hypothetical protein PPACK8108_LOCUS7802 [Phakopsora pachyrhizi]